MTGLDILWIFQSLFSPTRSKDYFLRHSRMSKCLIVDDDDELNVSVAEERCVPFAKSPIDEYRGRQRIRYIKSEKVFMSSNVCRWKCIDSQISMSCKCECKYDHYRILLEMAQEKIALYDGNQRVGFGRFKDYKWCDMMLYKESKSWCDWYIKNCKNNGEFYKYIILLKEITDLKDDIRYITNPTYD